MSFFLFLFLFKVSHSLLQVLRCGPSEWPRELWFLCFLPWWPRGTLFLLERSSEDGEPCKGFYIRNLCLWLFFWKIQGKSFILFLFTYKVVFCISSFFSLTEKFAIWSGAALVWPLWMNLGLVQSHWRSFQFILVYFFPFFFSPFHS